MFPSSWSICLWSVAGSAKSAHPSVTSGNASNRLASCRLCKGFPWLSEPRGVTTALSPCIYSLVWTFLLKQYRNNDTCRLPNLSRIDVSYPAVQPSNLRSAALWWDRWKIWIGEISFIPVLQERLRQPNVVLFRWILIHLCLCCALSISRQVL